MNLKQQSGASLQRMKAVFHIGGRYLSLACWMVAFLFVACQENVAHDGKQPLMQVGNKYLYREDMEKMIPYGTTKADSMAFAEDYMRKWVEEQLLYEKAELNVKGDERIARMVEDYRRSLILSEYEQRLLMQNMSEELSEEELQEYYEANKQFFMLEEPVIKGVFIKAPLTSPGLKDLKRWYKDNTETSIEQLESYAFRNAVMYEYFYDHWVPVSELEGKITINLAELGDEFDKHRNIEVEDENYCYLLHIEEFVVKGEEKPFELAKQEIIDLLANKRRVDFMRKVKDDLYNQSIEMGRIKYYQNEKMQIVDDTVHTAHGSTDSSAG